MHDLKEASLLVSSRKKCRTAGALGGQKNLHLPNILAFHRNNNLNLKFVRWKKLINQGSQYKFFFESKPKKSAWKGQFLGAPCNSVSGGQNDKIFIFLQNISSLTKSAISIHYELRSLGGGGYNSPHRIFSLANGPGPWGLKPRTWFLKIFIKLFVMSSSASINGYKTLTLFTDLKLYKIYKRCLTLAGMETSGQWDSHSTT